MPRRKAIIMTGKGAPHGNTYAAKERKGRSIGAYLKPDDLDILEASLRRQGKNVNEATVNDYARLLLRQAIQVEKEIQS